MVPSKEQSRDEAEVECTLVEMKEAAQEESANAVECT